MSVMGLDLGLRGACCYGKPDSLPTIEVWDFRDIPSDNRGQRYHAFQKRISSIIGAVATDLKLVVYENVTTAGHHKGAGSSHSWAGFLAMLEVECYLFQVPCEPVYYASAKKHVVGRGNCEKLDVLVALRERFPGVSIPGFDEADAVAMWLLGCRKLEA